MEMLFGRSQPHWHSKALICNTLNLHGNKIENPDIMIWVRADCPITAMSEFLFVPVRNTCADLWDINNPPGQDYYKCQCLVVFDKYNFWSWLSTQTWFFSETISADCASGSLPPCNETVLTYTGLCLRWLLSGSHWMEYIWHLAHIPY